MQGADIDKAIALPESVNPGTNVRVHSRAERAWWPELAAAFGAIVVCAIVVFLHRQSMRTLVSAHGLLHSAIAERFRAGVLPDFTPENPFFAGEPLPYYWVFHYIGARVAGVLHAHPLIGFELMILAAVGLVWFVSLRLGRRVYGSGLAGLFIAFLFFAAADGLGAWLLLAKLTIGGAALPGDSGSFLWGIAHPVLGVLGLGDRFALYQPLLVFFVNITSRPIALSLGLLTCLAIWNWLERGTGRSWFAILAAATMCALISPLLGIILGGSLAGGLLLVAFVVQRTAGRPADAQPWTGRATRGAAALILGVLAAAPTYYNLFLHGGGGLQLIVRPQIVLAVVTGATPLLALSYFSLRYSAGHRRRYLGVVMLAAAALLSAAAVIQLPAGNDSNFFHAAAAILAVPAAGVIASEAWATAGRRNLAAALLVAILLPTSALVVYAFTNRPAIALRIEDDRLVRSGAANSLAPLYTWLRGNTPANAVVVADPRPPIVAAGGNVPELPALTGRFLFTAQPSSYMVQPNPDARVRHDMAVHLATGGAPTSEQLDYLRRLARPVYILTLQAPADRMAALRASFGAPVFESAGAVLFQAVGQR